MKIIKTFEQFSNEDLDNIESQNIENTEDTTDVVEPIDEYNKFQQVLAGGKSGLADKIKRDGNLILSKIKKQFVGQLTEEEIAKISNMFAEAKKVNYDPKNPVVVKSGQICDVVAGSLAGARDTGMGGLGGGGGAKLNTMVSSIKKIIA